MKASADSMEERIGKRLKISEDRMDKRLKASEDRIQGSITKSVNDFEKLIGMKFGMNS